MFFDRPGLQSLSPSQSHSLDATDARARRHRRWAALALAVAVAAPVVVAPPSAYGQDAPAAAQPAAQPQKGPRELLQEGVRQFNSGQYEEAQANLQQVDPQSLSETERATHADILARAETASAQRRAARAEFEQGEAALAAKDLNKAATHYRNAAQNEYADAGTQRKAREQLAVAQSMGGRASDTAVAEAPVEEEGTAAAPRVSPRRAYQTAKAQYKKGDWINARKNFEIARQGGYKPGLFEDSPATYLARMDKKEQADAARAARRAEAVARRDAEAAERSEAEQKQIAMAAQQPAPGTEAPAQPPPAEPAPAEPAPAQPAPPQPPVAQQPPVQPEVRPEPPAPRTAEQDLEATARLQGVAGEQRAAEARKLVEEARRLQSEQRYNDAANRYDQALQLDPGNEQARAGRAEMLTLTGRAGGGNLLDQQQQAIEAQRQEIRYTFDSAITRARENANNNNFTEAQLQVERARAARSANPQIFTAGEINQMENAIAAVQQQVDTRQREFVENERIREQTQTARDLEAARQRERAERERTVAGLIGNSRQLINETRYTEALGVIDQILVIDPTNDYASGVRPLVEDKSILQEQRRYREDFDRNFARQLNQAEEKKIPYDDILRYPANWPDISELRDQTVAQERGEGTGDAETQKVLDTRLPEVKFEAAGFEEVVNFLRDVTGANIFVNWRALEGAGIDRAAPVTARLRDVKFAKALETILADVGGGTVTLSYTVDEGVITVSTSEDLSRNTFTQVYDIRDLIISVPDFEDPPEFNLSQTNAGGRGGGGGGQSLFGASGSQGEEEITREERIEQITQLIQETVAPDSWRDAGGTVGSVRELSGQLIVTQTPENHRQLMGLLEQLRETRAIQVTIEARFLTVQRNFLEDIGVDVDFIFNQDADADSSFSPIPVDQETSTFTANPSTGVPGSIGNIDRSLIGTPDNPLGTSAFSLGGTYLDDFGVSFLLRATHASANSTLLTAPRLTLFNGQRAYVVVATQRAYVSDLDPVVGTRAVGFDATIDLVQSGVLLDVQATVSSDRKYVTLTLRPTLARLVELVPFPFQTAAAPTDTGGGGDPTDPDGGGDIVIDDNEGIITATVQQPILEITEVRTTVSVPDGGTLLLGGQTLAGEVEREAGTPILSKIPFLKRLFTNRSMAKDEQVLLILVKPTILIQREAEQKQFPLLSTKIGG